ncbi:MAG: IS5 family transposase [Thermoplasmata archaeon]|nr:IS5 family transposase [Thermoplasmata archaeon]
MGNVSAGKRDCGLDTRAMEEFGRKLFDFDWNLTYSDDIRRMNDGKVGHPFVFSDSLIAWIVLLRTVLNISYRLMLGIVNHFLESEGFPQISLTQLFDRCTSGALNIGSDGRFLAFGTGNVCPKSRKITVALDSTGLSLNKYGGWMSHRWNMKKVTGWVKLHVAVDVDTNEILAFVVTDESVGDNSCTEKLMDLVMAAGHDVGCLLADAGYDSKENWRTYSGMGIKVCFNIKSSQLNKKFAPTGKFEVRAHGCLIRAKHMTRILEIGRDEWKKENGYPMRWKVECTFSDLKRILMDILRARTRWNCVQETLNMVSAHNLYKSIRVEMSEV